MFPYVKKSQYTEQCMVYFSVHWTIQLCHPAKGKAGTNLWVPKGLCHPERAKWVERVWSTLCSIQGKAVLSSRARCIAPTRDLFHFEPALSEVRSTQSNGSNPLFVIPTENFVRNSSGMYLPCPLPRGTQLKIQISVSCQGEGGRR